MSLGVSNTVPPTPNAAENSSPPLALQDTVCKSGPKGSEDPCDFGSLLSSERMDPSHSRLSLAFSHAPIPRPEGTVVGGVSCWPPVHVTGTIKGLAAWSPYQHFWQPVSLPLLCAQWLRRSCSAWHSLSVFQPQREQSTAEAELPQTTCFMEKKENHPYPKEPSDLEKLFFPSPLSHRGLTLTSSHYQKRLGEEHPTVQSWCLWLQLKAAKSQEYREE